MVSIIICTANNKKLDKLKKSIETTAVLENEIIVYHNVYHYGLCKVYNDCAGNAQNNFLCFVHDDVIFHTKGWDEALVKHLNNENTGVVGVMGGRYKSLFGVSWRDGPHRSYRMNVKDGVEGGKLLVYNPNNELANEVICLDGALLACTKKNWNKYPFNESLFKGFHFYDLDICLQMHLAGLKNYVVYDILIEHFSQGKKSQAFLSDFLLFQQQWAKKLPASITQVNTKDIKNFEGYALAETVTLMKKLKFPTTKRWTQISTYRRLYKNWYHFFRSLYFGFIK